MTNMRSYDSRSIGFYKLSFFLIILLCACSSLMSCASTKYYTEENIDILSDSEEDSSIHYVKENISIKAECTSDKDIILYRSFGAPFVFLGCTIRETGRVAFYTAVNVFSGLFSYYRLKDDGDIFGFYLPDIKAANKEYDAMLDDYHNSDVYIYRKYIGRNQKATITKTTLKEEVNWNEEVENVSSVTETLFAENDVKKSAAMLSKKASIVGSTVGKYTSYVVGIPGWVVGFIIGVASDN